MADGHIVISTTLEDKNIKRSLENLRSAVANVANGLNRSGAAAQAAESSMSKAFIRAKQKVEETEAALMRLDLQRDEIAAKKMKELEFLPYNKEQLYEAVEKSLEADKAYQKLTAQIDKMQTKLETYKSRMAAASNETSKAKENADKAKKSFDKMAPSAKQAGNSSKKAADSFNKTNQITRHLSKSILTATRMFKLMFLRMAVRTAFNGVREGFKDLVRYSSSTNKSMSDLVSGFRQTRNALAAAFAPALSAVTPVITSLTNTLNGALNALAAFNARLFGGTSTFIKASKVQMDYAKSLKETNKQLAKFDELNVLDKAEQLTPQDMFETVEIPPETVAFADTVKKLINDIITPFNSIDLTNITTAFTNLKQALEPFSQTLFEGFKWFLDNVLGPLAEWTIEDVLPAFLDLLSAALDALNEVLEALQPLWQWVWDNFLQPIAEWTGGVIVSVIEGLTEALKKFSSWASENQEVVSAVTATILAFLAELWIYNTTKKVAVFITTSLVPALKSFGATLAAVNVPLLVTGAAIAILAGGIITLASNWDKLTPAQRVKTILSGLAAAAIAAAVAIALFHTSWSVGLAAAAIAGGLALLASTILFTKTNASAVIPSTGGSTLVAAQAFAAQDFNSSPIPKLAKGAVIPPGSEFLAILGDQKSGRNLEAPESLIRQIVREESGRGTERIDLNMPIYIQEGPLIGRIIQTLVREGRYGRFVLKEV